MQSRFVKLSHDIYEHIDKTFKKNMNHPHLHSRLYERCRLIENETYLDIPSKEKKNGVSNYDGGNQFYLASKITKDYLMNHSSDFHFRNFKAFHREVDSYSANLYRLQNEHLFLKADLHDSNYIIDPTYKRLLIGKSGCIYKYNSPFADYLYGLPPVFIGTEEEMSTLKSILREEKKKDLLHDGKDILQFDPKVDIAFYDLIDHWHEEAKEFSIIRLDNTCNGLL